MKVTLDTNVLARAMVDDSTSPAQCRAAREALRHATAVVVPQAVQIELCWVLVSGFGLRHPEVLAVLRALNANPRIDLEQRELFEATLARFETDAGWSFADCMIAMNAQLRGENLLTFDRKFARLAGVEVLKAE